jgi:carbamate kinase
VRIVVALGGNALDAPTGATATQARVQRTAAQLARLILAGYEVVITHGNGPQVGELLLDQEARADRGRDRLPLDVLVAMTQAQLGYVLQREIEDELVAAGDHTDVVTVVTEIVVAEDDPAFDEPTKPVGPRLDARPDDRHPYLEGADGRWRRLVASPEPRHLVEHATLRAIVDDGIVPICAGGGGVPVVREGDRLRGVEAVIDKDLAGALLAREIGAERFAILTDVAGVAVGYGTDDEHWLEQVTTADLRRLQGQGEFAAGSMGPKVEAACRFVEASGGVAAIGALDDVAATVRGRAGTQVRGA